MEFWSIVALLSVSALLFFGLALCVAILFARVWNVEDLVEEKSEPKALEQALAKADGTAARVDNALLSIEKFREQIHSEMQRFYQIMRRNEKALKTEVAAEPEDEPPDEISVASLKKPPTESENASRADLRRLARERGHRI